MTQLEDLVRSTLHAQAETVPASTFAAPPRRRWLPVVAAMAAVIVVAIGVSAVVGRPAHPSATRPTPSHVAAPGFKTVSYHGITIDVPTSYQVGAFFCSAPTHDAVVLRAGPRAACPLPRSGPTSPPPESITVVGLDTFAAVSDRVPGMYLVTRRIEGPGVVVTISTPTKAIADQILASVRVVTVDPLGCVDRVTTFAPPGNVAASAFIAPNPLSGVVCVYQSFGVGEPAWLVGSATLTAVQLDTLVTTLNSATVPACPPTIAEASVFAWYHIVARNGRSRTVSASLDQTPQEVSDGVRTARFPSSSPYQELPAAI